MQLFLDVQDLANTFYKKGWILTQSGITVEQETVETDGNNDTFDRNVWEILEGYHKMEDWYNSYLHHMMYFV